MDWLLYAWGKKWCNSAWFRLIHRRSCFPESPNATRSGIPYIIFALIPEWVLGSAGQQKKPITIAFLMCCDWCGGRRRISFRLLCTRFLSACKVKKIFNPLNPHSGHEMTTLPTFSSGCLRSGIL